MIPRQQEAEFDEFVRRSGDRLARIAFLLCGDRGLVEDLVQDTLVRTARRWSRARRQPDAYARRVLINLTKDHWIRRSRRPVQVAEQEAPDQATAPTDLLIDQLDLFAAVQRLPPGQRAVLVLRYFDDLTVEATAATLGCSVGTVKSQSHRALQALRHQLSSDIRSGHHHEEHIPC